MLKEYRQNQELVRKIGGHYYQIIYPVQLRHHEKMGISTREVGGASKGSTTAGRARPRVRHPCLKIHFIILTISILFSDRLENIFTELHCLSKRSIINSD